MIHGGTLYCWIWMVYFMKKYQRMIWRPPYDLGKPHFPWYFVRGWEWTGMDGNGMLKIYVKLLLDWINPIPCQKNTSKFLLGSQTVKQQQQPQPQQQQHRHQHQHQHKALKLHQIK